MKYIRIDKYDEDGDKVLTYLEPFNIDSLSVAIESELLEDGEVDETLVLTIVEMEPEEYEEFNRENGY